MGVKRTKSRESKSSLAIRPSTFPGAGLGLFAARDFRSGEALPETYKGRLLDHDKFRRVRDYSYCLILEGDPEYAALDAKSLKGPRNPLRYVNGAKTQLQMRNVNVKMTRRGRIIRFVTTKLVREGTEFVV